MGENKETKTHIIEPCADTIEDDIAEEYMLGEYLPWIEDWCNDFNAFVAKQSAIARLSVTNGMEYIENQKAKWQEAQKVIDTLDEIRYIEKPFYGRFLQSVSDGAGYFSRYLMLDFSASLFKLDEHSIEATNIFRELINLCDDFNVFMLDQTDSEHDHMRCVFVFYNTNHFDILFGDYNDEESEAN